MPKKTIAYGCAAANLRAVLDRLAFLEAENADLRASLAQLGVAADDAKSAGDVAEHASLAAAWRHVASAVEDRRKRTDTRWNRLDSEGEGSLTIAAEIGDAIGYCGLAGDDLGAAFVRGMEAAHESWDEDLETLHKLQAERSEWSEKAEAWDDLCVSMGATSTEPDAIVPALCRAGLAIPFSASIGDAVSAILALIDETKDLRATVDEYERGAA